ncbi:MAG: (d)CMP kinase [Saprospiraceae bacterium]|jgi:cytidylate kinase|nr:(d)CMP kinase [Saprospiraceae bacterium]
MKKIVVAIDGHSSCGKSTLAKALAKELTYIYVDSGAMYRACTLYFLNHQIDINDINAVQSALQHIHISFQVNTQGNQTYLNEQNVEEEIRGMRVSTHVSAVATIPEVRRAMVKIQQALGKQKGIVMDGRDIGTVVFPNAALKIFLTASIEERTKRRYKELKVKNPSITFEAVQKNLQERDHIDSTRADSPLKQAEDAVLIDNTDLSRAQQLQMVVNLVQERINI